MLKQYAPGYIVLAILLHTCYEAPSAAETEVTISPLENGSSDCLIELQSSEFPNHEWEVQVSRDLEIWESHSKIYSVNGYGSTTFSAETENGPVFYRTTIEDYSVAAILNLPESPYNYANITLPAHLRTNAVQNEDNTPPNNPVTDHGATLGRVLFYDTKLSRNDTVSCASCHVQEQGFSDPRALSVGFEGGLTGRNSMGLASAKFYEREHFFWDERADTLEDQVLMPIQDPVEMGMDLDTLVSKLQGYEYYETLFANAFGDSEVTTERISLALAQFVRSIVSYQTKYDEGEQTNFANFTAIENQGRMLFNSGRARCSDCHEGPNFVGDQIENNGLEFPFIDLGVGGATGNANDEGKFKMSSLRNIELTAPYMHDGRHETLEEVVEHYSTGIIANPNLGNELELPGGGNQPIRPNFNQQEIDALVAFMKTLTDHELTSDPKFSNPFK